MQALLWRLKLIHLPLPTHLATLLQHQPPLPHLTQRHLGPRLLTKRRKIDPKRRKLRMTTLLPIQVLLLPSNNLLPRHLLHHSNPTGTLDVLAVHLLLAMHHHARPVRVPRTRIFNRASRASSTRLQALPLSFLSSTTNVLPGIGSDHLGDAYGATN